MTPQMLECRGTCRAVTVHRSRTEGHAECCGCGTARRESTSSMDGNETVSMKWAERSARTSVLDRTVRVRNP